MRIETAEHQAAKILEFASSLANSKVNLYGPTRTRMTAICESCTEAVRLLTTRLNENSVIAEPVNPDSMYSRYMAVLNRVCDSASVEIQPCLCVMRDWFYLRILQNYKYTKIFEKRFLCTKSRIKSVLYSIVILYGYHLEHDTMNQFMTDVQVWKDSIGVDEITTIRYAFISESYQIEQKHNKRFANSTAIRIWDTMWESGLNELGDESFGQAALSRNGVYILTENMDVSVIDAL